MPGCRGEQTSSQFQFSIAWPPAHGTGGEAGRQAGRPRPLLFWSPLCLVFCVLPHEAPRGPAYSWHASRDCTHGRLWPPFTSVSALVCVEWNSYVRACVSDWLGFVPRFPVRGVWLTDWPWEEVIHHPHEGRAHSCRTHRVYVRTCTRPRTWPIQRRISAPNWTLPRYPILPWKEYTPSKVQGHRDLMLPLIQYHGPRGLGRSGGMETLGVSIASKP
jgi:hypothetical protein